MSCRMCTRNGATSNACSTMHEEATNNAWNVSLKFGLYRYVQAQYMYCTSRTATGTRIWNCTCTRYFTYLQCIPINKNCIVRCVLCFVFLFVQYLCLWLCLCVFVTWAVALIFGALSVNVRFSTSKKAPFDHHPMLSIFVLSVGSFPHRVCYGTCAVGLTTFWIPSMQ